MTPFTTDNPDILDLQPRLQHADPGVRRIALIELADLEDPDGLPWLTDALLVDPHVEVRAEAARLLEAWEAPEVVQALCAALADAAEPVRLDLHAFLDSVVQAWCERRNCSGLHYHNAFGSDLPMVADSAIQQMIGNVLDNAADASPQAV